MVKVLVRKCRGLQWSSARTSGHGKAGIVSHGEGEISPAIHGIMPQPNNESPSIARVLIATLISTESSSTTVMEPKGGSQAMDAMPEIIVVPVLVAVTKADL
jgi:hypothetical protein